MYSEYTGSSSPPLPCCGLSSTFRPLTGGLEMIQNERHHPIWPRTSGPAPGNSSRSKVHFPAATASWWGFQVFFDLSPSSVLLRAKPRSQKRVYIDHQASSPKLASNSLSPNPSWGLQISDQIVGSQGVFLDPLTAHASWAVEPTGLPHSPAADWSLVSSPHDPDLGKVLVLVIQGGGWGRFRECLQECLQESCSVSPLPTPPLPAPLGASAEGCSAPHSSRFFLSGGSCCAEDSSCSQMSCKFLVYWKCVIFVRSWMKC